MSLLTFNLSTVCTQEQKPQLKLVQEVRCLIAYIKGRETFVPIKPEVTTQRAKKTGYRYSRQELQYLTEDFMWAEIWGIPEDLEEVCYVRKVSTGG